MYTYTLNLQHIIGNVCGDSGPVNEKNWSWIILKSAYPHLFQYKVITSSKECYILATKSALILTVSLCKSYNILSLILWKVFCQKT